MLVTPCPSSLMTDVRPVNRVVGLETEYGALVHDAELSTEAWPARVKNYIFRQARAGALDLHYRDYEEPPGNGGRKESTAQVRYGASGPSLLS